MLASGEVKVPEDATKQQEEPLLRQAMNQPLEGTTTYVTGGDVSRFQRSSMPLQQPRRADGTAAAGDVAGAPMLARSAAGSHRPGGQRHARQRHHRRAGFRQVNGSAADQRSPPAFRPRRTLP